MNVPRIELIPARWAACSDEAVTLDVLARITPPLPDVHFPRPKLNLALVLDRSGSMSEGKKMEYAREAAAFAVSQLLGTDRVSITVFDDQIETTAPGALATDKPRLIRSLNAVHPRGSTDLHRGWKEGAHQAEVGLLNVGINRVMLLSDGMANVGVTDPATIASEARGIAARGVSTTTLGVGESYNEDLLESMASAGDGHYYYIETPTQLTDIFQTELQGLMATIGNKVSLGLEPAEGVVVSDVLNDYEKLESGRFKLSNLVAGMPILTVIRLTVPARRMCGTLLNVRLAWDDSQGHGRQVLIERLGGLPVQTKLEWEALPVDPEVFEQQSLLMAARAQKEASRAHERGDVAGTRRWLAASYDLCAAVPGSAAMIEELGAIEQMRTALDAEDTQHFRKFAKWRSYQRRESQNPVPPTSKNEPET
jgi:Ca-activated chloride channel family protein